MNKKGAEGVIWLRVVYFVMALVIVVIVYGFLSERLENTLHLGYASRELAMNIDVASAGPGGKLVIRESFNEEFYVKTKDGEINVKSAKDNKSIEYWYFAGNDPGLNYDSGKKAGKDFICESGRGCQLNG